MSGRSRLFLACGALAAALAVAAGAFGAHALRARLEPGLLSAYETAVAYHFYHALGLLALGLVADRLPASRLVTWAGGFMLAGLVLFPGSLYGLSVFGAPLGPVTPLGGLSFIVAWILFAVALLARGAGRG